MAAEPRDRVDVWLLRRPRKVADHHVFDHAMAKRARRGHRGPPVMRGGGCDDHILSDGRLHLSPFPPAPKEQVRSISPPRGPRSVLWVVVVTTSKPESNGLRMTFAATSPPIWEMSAIVSAPTRRQLS